MNELLKYIYEGSEVTFSNGDNVMVNATQMAKAFGKEVKHWGENNSTTEFILSLARAREIEPNPHFANLLNISEVGKFTSLSISDLAKLFPSLIKVVRGSLEEQGTWMHEDAALEFARWLSPSFAIWCNDRIKELIKNGVSDIRETPADRMKELEIEEMKARKGIADSLRELMNIETLSPSWKQILAAKSAEVLSGGEKILPLPKSEVSYSATDIAKELGTSSTMVGRIAKANNLKVKEYGEWYHDKSKYSSKEVDVFRYNQKGFDIIRNIFFNRFR